MSFKIDEEIKKGSIRELGEVLTRDLNNSFRVSSRYKVAVAFSVDSVVKNGITFDRLVFELVDTEKKEHSERVLRAANALLRQHELKPKDILIKISYRRG